MERPHLAVITGSGLFQPGLLTESQELTVNTPYGEIWPTIGKLNGVKVTFLPRHGKNHSMLPHQLNYRANLWGLKTLGINRIIATTAVGSLREELGPGSMVIIDQFIDFTKQRPLTFFEGAIHQAHLDVTEPYCPDIRECLRKSAVDCGLDITFGGCYVCTEGPRYETAAEVRMFQKLGGDLVGMTGVPEVVLARELGMCYANLSVVTNLAAGISKTRLTHAEVIKVTAQNHEKTYQLLTAGITAISKTFNCTCGPNEEDNDASQNP